MAEADHSAPAHPRRGGRVAIAGLSGLTAEEVHDSRAAHGDNVLTPPVRRPWWELLLEKFDDPVIRILLVAAFISLGVGILGEGHYVEPVGILTAVVLATVLAFANEYKAGKEFDILNQVSDEVPVKVVRDGAITTVPRRDLVVGDVVLVETGDEVPADGEVLESVSLEVDESRLTGESLPVSKAAQETDGEASGTYAGNRLLRSTLVADGHGAMVVRHVGDATEIGQTARAASEEPQEPTPLNCQLERLSKLIGVVGFTIAGVTFTGLVIRSVIVGDLVLPSHQWWFLAAMAGGLAVAFQRVWVTLIFDGLELVGLAGGPPGWLERGGLRAWVKTLAGGGLVFGLLLGALMAIGEVPPAPSTWLSLEAGEAFLDFFMIAVVIIVVAVPEGLAMSVTLSLAYSMRKMTATNNLVRRMHACETIGAATVICSDKTGTLTQNRMRLQEAHWSFREGGPVGDPGWLRDTDEGRLLVEAVTANSTANLSFEDAEGHPIDEPRIIGNPTEGALLVRLSEADFDYVEERARFHVTRQWAFNTQRKYMATLGAAGDDAPVLHVKGAPEILLERSSGYLGPGGERRELNDAFCEDVHGHLRAMQQRGMRTLGFAYTPHEGVGEVPDDPDEIVCGLTWLGFVAIADPVRPDVPDAIERCRAAGIDVKVVTGDNALTAQEIARQITLLDAEHPGALMTGPEFAELSDEDLEPRLGPLKVLARARPADKLRLVQLLQARGEVVAVTGDGTNDAPALNHANVGLAMGRSGTAVAKEAADIVLLDDSFPSIVNAVKWGRSLYSNIQRFILFQLTINVAACIVAMLGPYIGVKFPLTVLQMLWVNLIMDTFAALALATEPPREEVLKRPPRDPRSFIITPWMGVSILGTGALFVVVLIVLLKTNFLGGEDVRHEQTLFFHFFVMLQFWNLFNARALGTNRSGLAGLLTNRAFLAIALVIAVGQAAIVQFGGDVFRTTALDLVDWAKIVGLTSLVLIVGEVVRFTQRRGER